MKFNVSGISIAFYLFCGAVILSEYSYVGPTTTKNYFKKNSSFVELHNRTRMPASTKKEKENWPAAKSAQSNSTSTVSLNK